MKKTIIEVQGLKRSSKNKKPWQELIFPFKKEKFLASLGTIWIRKNNDH